VKSTQHFDKNKKSLECLNCGHPLRGDENFCPECAQVNDVRRLSLKDYLSGFFANFFSFDSRLYRTLMPLLLKPGKVAIEYIEGKRKKYANPFQLLLHIVIVYFLLLGFIQTFQKFTTPISQQNDTRRDIVSISEDSVLIKKTYSSTSLSISSKEKNFESIYQQKLDSVFQKENLINFLNNDSISNIQKDTLINRLHEMGVQIMHPEFSRTKTFFKKSPDAVLYIADDMVKTAVFLQKYLDNQGVAYRLDSSFFKDPFIEMKEKSLGLKLGRLVRFTKEKKEVKAPEGLDSLGMKKTHLNLFLYDKSLELNHIFSNEKSLQKFWDTIVSKVSISLFFLLPLFTLLFSLLYWRHPYQYSEHLVVVFYLQIAFFLILIAGLIIDAILPIDFVGIILKISFVFYIYKSLRNVYKQKRFITLIKLLVLNLAFFLLSLIGFIVISFIVFLL